MKRKRTPSATVVNNTTLHPNGCVTYWSVYDSCWRNYQANVPDRELAAMSPEERAAVQAHIARTTHTSD